ncbi:alginate lyase [Penicillium brasilianum]|uniref:Alginate lyase n=1 Tax=Penicillium brasilianum TaxID=104259 RepID=A0A1S9R8W7_PENBI|nr:alginate lyase [Penicillium brasilianum]
MTLHPSTVVLDGFRLTEARKRIRQGADSALQTALEALTKQADQWLAQAPWSVTMKTVLPPSGDKHDYTSLAPYWWPNPNSPDGKPYINRDGKKNPEVLNYTDRVYWEKVFSSSTILALAWHYTGNEAYARHAGDILRTWFINPETRMNSNLNHAQLIPYANKGRCIGIIDFSQAYTSLLDAAAILAFGTTEAQGPGITPSRAPGWTDVDVEGFRRWNVDFLEWLTHSPFGREELAQSNNHGSFAAMQIAAIALFLGDTDRARNEVLAVRAHLRDTIAPDGSQPEELRRTRSWHYSTFNLLALTRLACVGQKLGVDLWKFAGPGGEGSISRAVDFIIPVATGSGSWPYPELGFKAYAAADIIRTAATAGHQRAKEALDLLQMPPAGDLWPLRPAPEQLDGVVVDEYSK